MSCWHHPLYLLPESQHPKRIRNEGLQDCLWITHYFVYICFVYWNFTSLFVCLFFLFSLRAFLCLICLPFCNSLVCTNFYEKKLYLYLACKTFAKLLQIFYSFRNILYKHASYNTHQHCRSNTHGNMSWIPFLQPLLEHDKSENFVKDYFSSKVNEATPLFCCS